MASAFCAGLVLGAFEGLSKAFVDLGDFFEHVGVDIGQELSGDAAKDALSHMAGIAANAAGDLLALPRSIFDVNDPYPHLVLMTCLPSTPPPYTTPNPDYNPALPYPKTINVYPQSTSIGLYVNGIPHGSGVSTSSPNKVNVFPNPNQEPDPTGYNLTAADMTNIVSEQSKDRVTFRFFYNPTVSGYWGPVYQPEPTPVEYQIPAGWLANPTLLPSMSRSAAGAPSGAGVDASASAPAARPPPPMLACILEPVELGVSTVYTLVMTISKTRVVGGKVIPDYFFTIGLTDNPAYMIHRAPSSLCTKTLQAGFRDEKGNVGPMAVLACQSADPYGSGKAIFCPPPPVNGLVYLRLTDVVIQDVNPDSSVALTTYIPIGPTQSHNTSCVTPFSVNWVIGVDLSQQPDEDCALVTACTSPDMPSNTCALSAIFNLEILDGPCPTASSLAQTGPMSLMLAPPPPPPQLPRRAPASCTSQNNAVLGLCITGVVLGVLILIAVILGMVFKGYKQTQVKT
jgi:hypothetical protein